MTIPTTITVAGAGRMGSGIAHSFLVAGSRVQLRDIDDNALARGRAAVVRSLQRAHEKGVLTGSVDETLDRLETRVGLDDIGDPDLVVEAVPEIPGLKQSVLEQIAAGVSGRTVIATNTSSISVEGLSRFVPGSGRFIGLHFFNPVPVSSLVEIVRAPATADVTVELASAWVNGIGKQSIVVNDAPGFATSRLGLVIGLEAIRMLEEGVASAEDIDQGMVLGYGFPVGPLKLTDIVGLDIRLEIAEYLESRLGSRFAPPALLRKLVSAGDLGRKSGRGFYDWTAS